MKCSIAIFRLSRNSLRDVGGRSKKNICFLKIPGRPAFRFFCYYPTHFRDTIAITGYSGCSLILPSSIFCFSVVLRCGLIPC